MPREITEQQIVDLQVAVAELDAGNDRHWSNQGLPALGVVRKGLDWQPSQKEMRDYTAGYSRAWAHHLPEDGRAEVIAANHRNGREFGELTGAAQPKDAAPTPDETGAESPPDEGGENQPETGAAPAESGAESPSDEGGENQATGSNDDAARYASGRLKKSPQRRALEVAEANGAISTLRNFCADYAHESGVYKEAGRALERLQGVINARP